jgi:hypothetical protein
MMCRIIDHLTVMAWQIIHKHLVCQYLTHDKREYLCHHRSLNCKESEGRFFPSLNLVQPDLCANFGVKRIGIFGSFARGEEKRTRDVDVLVEFAPGPGNL